MKINVFADTICGWCFIGHTNLNEALKKFPNLKFDIHHTPFQLNPDMPTEGISRDKYLEIKFGGKDYAASMYENMKLKAKETGINLNGQDINEFGISFGVGIPVGRLFSNVNVGFEIGKRGTTDFGLIQENFFNTFISLSFNDRWFDKRYLD